jgi:hypothetical protein
MPIPIMDMNKMGKKDTAHFVLSLFLPISLPTRKKTISLPRAPCSISVSYLVKETSLSHTHTNNISESLAASPNKSTRTNIFLSDQNYKTRFSPLFSLRPDLTYLKEKIGGRPYLMGRGDGGRRRISEHNLIPKSQFSASDLALTNNK